MSERPYSQGQFDRAGEVMDAAALSGFDQRTQEVFAEALAAAIRAGRIAGLSEAAEMHDAEIARLETQIAENTTYCERTGQDPNCLSNRFCRNSQDWHRRSAKDIRAKAAKIGEGGE